MITANEVKREAAHMRCTFELLMDLGAYERHYQSDTHPRFRKIEYAGPMVGVARQQRRSTKLMVDFVECIDMQAVATALNYQPVGMH